MKSPQRTKLDRKDKQTLWIALVVLLAVLIGGYFLIRQNRLEHSVIRVKLLSVQDYGITKQTNLHEGKLTFQDTIDGKTHTYNLCTSDSDWNNTVFVNAFYDMPYQYYSSAQQSKNPQTLGCSGSIYPSGTQ